MRASRLVILALGATEALRVRPHAFATMESNHKRALVGTTADPFLQQFGDDVV
jgi:hypothetical protein